MNIVVLNNRSNAFFFSSEPKFSVNISINERKNISFFLRLKIFLIPSVKKFVEHRKREEHKPRSQDFIKMSDNFTRKINFWHFRFKGNEKDFRYSNTEVAHKKFVLILIALYFRHTISKSTRFNHKSSRNKNFICVRIESVN